MDLFERKQKNILDISSIEVPDNMKSRVTSTVEVIDEALGGGFVRQGVLLLGGEPGVGKTTFLMQLMSRMSGEGIHCVYNSAEESVEQLKMTYDRIQAENSFGVVNIGDTQDLFPQLDRYRTDFLVVDSIQGLYTANCRSRPGSIPQTKAACNELIAYAKDHSVILVIICQLNTDGSFNGPRALEHNVDTVGKILKDKTDPQNFRFLSFSKNRFGTAGLATRLRWLGGIYDFEYGEGIVEDEEAKLEAQKLDSKKKKKGEPDIGTEQSNPDFKREAIIVELSKRIEGYKNASFKIFGRVALRLKEDMGDYYIHEDDYEILDIPKDQLQGYMRLLSMTTEFRLVDNEPLVIQL